MANQKKFYAFVLTWLVSIKGRKPYTEHSFHLRRPDLKKAQGRKKAHQIVSGPVRRNISKEDYSDLVDFEEQLGEGWIWSFDPKRIVPVRT